MTIGTLAGGVVGAIAVLIVFGVPPLIARATTPATAAEAAAGVVRSLVLGAVLVLLVPSFEKIFVDFGAKVPAVTAAIFQASHAAGTISLPTCLLLFGTETFAFYRLYRNADRRPQARRLSGITTAACCAAVLLIVVAIVVPLLRLVSQLG